MRNTGEWHLDMVLFAGAVQRGILQGLSARAQALFMLYAVIFRSSETGLASPSDKTVLELLGKEWTEKSLQRARRELRETGLIEVVHKPSRAGSTENKVNLWEAVRAGPTVRKAV